MDEIAVCKAVGQYRSREEWYSSNLRQILDALPTLVFVAEDPDCRNMFGNRATEMLLRAPPGANVSRSNPDAVVPRQFDVFDNTGRLLAPEELPVQRARLGEEVRGAELELRFHDGTATWIYGTATPLRDDNGNIWGAVGAFADITERKRSNVALRHSEELVRATSYVTFRMSPDWLEMRELDGRGFFPDTREPNQNWLSEYIYPEDQAHVWSVIQAAIRTKSVYELEHRVWRADGSIGWTSARAVPLLDQAGEITEWFGAGTDITPRKKAELASQEAKVEVERAARAQSEFFAAASHDLRQPFQAMRLFFEVIEGSATVGQQPAIRLLRESMQVAEDLLNTLLDVARIENGAIAPVLVRVDLADVVRELTEALKPLAAQEGLVLRNHVTSVEALTDPGLLNRILFNLATNALKYTTRGGVLIGLRRRSQEVTVEVWDTGIGIADDQAEHIFEEFYQVQNPSRDREKGVGLGLSIVKRLCKLLDCKIAFRSRIGKGSVFRVSLRLAP